MGIFASSIRSNAEAILIKVNSSVYSIAWQLFTSTVRLTPSPDNPGPYAQGMLSNQWYPKAGSPSAASGNSMSPNGSASLQRITEMMKGKEFLGKDGRLFLTNNTPYAVQAELIGWPRTKPYRMVAKSLQAVAARNKRSRIKVS